MTELIKAKFTGKKEAIENIIECLKAENIVMRSTDFLENDKDKDVHIFVVVIARDAVVKPLYR